LHAEPDTFWLRYRAAKNERLIAIFFLSSDEIAEARAAASMAEWSDEDGVYLKN
jgi:hypothetical protein